MIPLEKQVTSLEPSKELKELGVKQDGIYYWTWAEWGGKTEWVLLPRDRGLKLKKEKYSAFTVAELDQKLLPYIEQRDEKYYLLITKTNKTEYYSLLDYYVGYRNIRGTRFLHSEREDNGANSRAKMIIYLLKNKLMRVGDD